MTEPSHVSDSERLAAAMKCIRGVEVTEAQVRGHVMRPRISMASAPTRDASTAPSGTSPPRKRVRRSRRRICITGWT